MPSKFPVIAALVLLVFHCTHAVGENAQFQKEIKDLKVFSTHSMADSIQLWDGQIVVAAPYGTAHNHYRLRGDALEALEVPGLDEIWDLFTCDGQALAYGATKGTAHLFRKNGVAFDELPLPTIVTSKPAPGLNQDVPLTPIKSSKGIALLRERSQRLTIDGVLTRKTSSWTDEEYTTVPFSL